VNCTDSAASTPVTVQQPGEGKATDAGQKDRSPVPDAWANPPT
jgi:hypothetical protein